MSDLKQKGRQFSDAEYLEAMAKHFDGQVVPELRAHAERLRAMAAKAATENVAEDTYFAIADELKTESGWSVLEHVQYARELMQEAVFAFGRAGANADLSHPHRTLWEKLRGCLEGNAPGGSL